jgi:hypothetical protein
MNLNANTTTARVAVTAERIEAVLGGDPRVLEEVRSTLDGNVVARKARQFLMLRMPDATSEPRFLDTVVGTGDGPEGRVVTLTDEQGESTATLAIAPSEHGLRFRLRVEAPGPLWMVEWRLSDLDLAEVIVPALGGQRLAPEMPVGTTLSYKYPFWWNAQFVLGSAGRGGFWMRTLEKDPRFKVLRVRRDDGTFSWSIGFEADGPLTERVLEAEWFLDAWIGDWQVPVQIHSSWLAEAFGLRSFSAHPRFPSWAGDINFILEMWGMHRERPEPAQTFDEMTDRLREFADLHDPATTLVYLPGFAEHGIDSNAPDYHPASKLGGREGFGRLLRAAHEMGYRVMVHTNVLAMTYHHPRFPEFAAHQVVDVFGRKQGWAMDIDGDWLPEPFFAYINPGVEAWGDHMETVIGELVMQGVDAVFLDQTLLAFNVKEGPNFVAGMRRHIERLQQAFPGILFAGEGLHEQNVAALPFAQIHGIDSIAEVQNMDDRRPWRTAHPVSTRLFGPFTRFTAHLLTRHPTHPMFTLQEEAYGHLGVLPALVLYDRGQKLDLPETREMIGRARALNSASATFKNE